ncbi:MAG TPA: hypothetical protein VHP14_18625 [Anaerolineales bacterium]|nr:hypothetical protein [Anaerolineales bacterium]
MQKIQMPRRDFLAGLLKKGLPVRFLLLIIILASSLLIQQPGPVVAGSFSPANEGNPTSPTPTPTDPEPTRGTSPVVGILVLLAPLVFIVWKSRGLKEPKVTASCCAPVIDENKRPFQIEED